MRYGTYIAPCSIINAESSVIPMKDKDVYKRQTIHSATALMFIQVPAIYFALIAGKLKKI